MDTQKRNLFVFTRLLCVEDRASEAVSRARIVRRDDGQGKHVFPVLLTRRVGNQTVVDPCPAERADRINLSRS